MRSECCVCHTVLKACKPGTDPDDGRVSHSFCPECAGRAVAESREVIERMAEAEDDGAAV